MSVQNASSPQVTRSFRLSSFLISRLHLLATTLERHPRLVLGGMIALWAVVLFGGLTLKYLSWAQGYDQIDYEQSIWNTTQGRFLEISHYRHTDSLWGMDFIPAILLIVPFYALVPSALTLHVFQVLFMSLGALPVYGIARDRFGGSKLAGLGWAAIYLLYPSLWFVTMGAPWQPRTLAVPALLGAFYFLQSRASTKGDLRNWLLYMGCLLLALTSRTEASLCVLGIGLLAALWRRGWRWALPPVVLGLAWFVFSTSVVVPAFYRADYHPQEGAVSLSPEEDYSETWPGKSPQLAYYSHLGNSSSEIVWTVITNPLKVAQLVLTPPKLTYLFLMLLPLLLLPLLAPDAALPALPILAMNVLSNRTFQITIREQYQALVIPGLIIAAIVGGARLWAFWKQRGFPRLPEVLLGALVVCALISNIAYKNPVWTTLRYREAPERLAAMEALRAMVPPDAPLATTSFLAPRMMPRREIYYLPTSPAFPPLERAEYLFIDTRASALQTEQNRDFVAKLRASPVWQVLAEREDLLLMQRR